MAFEVEKLTNSVRFVRLILLEMGLSSSLPFGQFACFSLLNVRLF